MLTTLLTLAHADDSAPPWPDARFALALYCNPTCDDRVLDELDRALTPIKAGDGFPERAETPLRIMGIAGPDFGIPDAEYVATYGVGITDPSALTRSQEVLLAWFAGPREAAVETVAIAQEAFARAAERTGGWVEDLDTGSVYSAPAWRARDPRGELTQWFVVESAPVSEAEGAPHRLVTRGLRRFGDCELVVEDVRAEAAPDVGYVVNTIAEAVHRVGQQPGQLAMPSLLTISSDTVQGQARFSVVAAGPDDPEDPLCRVRFDGAITGAGDAPAGQPPVAEPVPLALAAVAAVGPPPPEPAPRAPTNLREAQVYARERLESVVHPAWDAGLPPGEKVAVSVPFTTRTGKREYLWVEVTSWSGDRLKGVVANEPYNVPGLRKGDTVDVVQGDVFDYVWKRADGTREGNWTRGFVGG